jgi:hypothetical protein
VSHFHVTKTRTMGNGTMTERVGLAWATQSEAEIMAGQHQTLMPGKFEVDGPCDCPAELNIESANRLLGTLQRQTAEILARQRDYGMHDPGCDKRKAEKHYAQHPDYSPAGPGPVCNCWLAE